MKKIFGLLLLTLTLQASAQEAKTKDKPKAVKPAKVEEPKAPKIKPDYSKLDLSKRASDHFMLQFGMAGWGKPDEITTKGFSRTFNGYFLFDFPFKSNPRLSVAVGPGVGTDNIFFDKTTVDLNDRTGVKFLRDTITRYKKHKLVTGYVEAPIELRYSTNPENMNKGWKFAFGAKIGTLIDAKMKSKIDLDATGTGGYYTKEKDRRYINSTRFALIGRVGLGNFSVFGSYTVTDFFKEGLGPSVRPYSFGVVLSGL
ncbi:MAG: hypothetical protein RLZZ420_1547 [Bacteroidota bacterium]|jgi:hypothetical protein